VIDPRLPVLTTARKELGSHHTHLRKMKNAEKVENQLFLDPMEK
jgi:hypothetical protein